VGGECVAWTMIVLSTALLYLTAYMMEIQSTSSEYKVQKVVKQK
jgi:hypothetical protein